MKKKVAIVGAGMIGLCSAYYLRKKGHEVIVIDDHDGYGGASVGNAGFLCPSHVVPLASPGIITQGIKWMLNEKSPFYIKPRLNKELISWGLKFKKAATAEKVKTAAPFLHQITTASQKLAEQLLEDEKIDAGYNRNGLLMLCQSEKELHHEQEAADIAKGFGQSAEILTPEEVAKLNPGLDLNICGAVYFPNDTMINPHIFLKEFQKVLKADGVEFMFNTKIKAFEKENGEVTGLVTSSSTIKADDYVLAAGSATSQLLRLLGVSLPMVGGKGYSFTVNNPPATPKVPAILADGKVSMSPMMDGLRFSGTMEINDLNSAINHKRVQGIIDTVTSFLPQFKKSNFTDIKPWSGFRPCSPDGLPYVGKSKKFSNLTVAAGHAMLGITLGPVTGDIVAKIINEEPSDMDLSLLAVDRYN
ncbi:FAD-dependent oxidoreductase [Fulvivirga maritima]|uniref:NAD(P)/FAD-dependent oxidoreductase n=1 Tax=Fulvivirga maritima TaxID=2904247 RepID=UPI001F3FF693|nr:FAD-dependent oxidoreductase [Fulvivirga maritima]UII26193.1 FAD-dependent oxidoreductase [Fulvivirga maritima]